MDSTAFFHDIALGADNGVTGIVTLLGAAFVLGEYKRKLTVSIFFLLFFLVIFLVYSKYFVSFCKMFEKKSKFWGYFLFNSLSFKARNMTEKLRPILFSFLNGVSSFILFNLRLSNKTFSKI